MTSVSYPLDADTPTSHLPFGAKFYVANVIAQSETDRINIGDRIRIDDIEGEVRRSISNFESVLKAAGTDLAHVVQTRNYVRDPADLERYNEIYRELFPDPKPARTTITHCLDDSLRYEIECIAVLPADGDMRDA